MPESAFLDAVGRMRPGTDAGPGESAGVGALGAFGTLTAEEWLELFDAQLGSRHLDLAMRRLREAGEGFYTIGSAGHESNAAVAGAVRPDDPALLHYRSGAFYLARARQAGMALDDAMRDILLGVVAAAAEPIAGGRHKVFGRHQLSIIPQTSTIASHLPRALGIAFALARAAKLGVPSPWPPDAIVVCSLGDASVNHSTATGAVNAALHAAHQGLPVPLLLVCEDNGIGISVRTPPGWVREAYGSRPGLRYLFADGSAPASAHAAAVAAADHVRRARRPAFLHLRTVRLMGHAGSDVESAYRTQDEINADLAADPLLGTARLLISAGVLTPSGVAERYRRMADRVDALASSVVGSRRLASSFEVMAPLSTTPPKAAPLPGPPPPVKGGSSPRAEAPGRAGPMTVALAINSALRDLLAEDPRVIVFGEDVARKGGVYGVTRGLLKEYGAGRVFDTLLDEQSILGLALGSAVSGLLPIPEIQYLAYLHNAEDQLRGEAATLPFFSNRQYHNPMIVRIAAYAYQKGFGGHFHNDNAVGVLRDIPGLVVASPARPDDAAGMLRACAASGRVCVFLEPIALYHTRSLHEEGDDAWLAPPASAPIPLGHGRLYGDGDGLTLVTFGNGLHMSLRVARRLERSGIRCRILDLRWLAPLPVDDLMRAAGATGRVLIVDETRRTGGVSEGVITALVDAGFDGRIARVAGRDSFIPLGDAADHVLVSEDGIEKAALTLAST